MSKYDELNNTDDLIKLIIGYLRKKIHIKFAFVHYKYTPHKIEIIERHNKYTRYKCILIFKDDCVSITNAKLGTKHSKISLPYADPNFLSNAVNCINHTMAKAPLLQHLKFE